MVAQPIDAPDGALPPQNLEAERHLLGALLLDPGATEGVAGLLRPAHFWRDAHRLVYAAALALHRRGSAVSLSLLTAELEARGTLDRAGGTPYLAELIAQTEDCTLAPHYARAVHEAALKRQLVQAGGRVATAAYERDAAAALREAQDLIAGVATETAAGRGPLTFTAAELLAKEFPDARDVVPGVLYEGLTILASRPKLGKTWLMLGTAAAVASGGYALGTVKVDAGDVLYLALEDGEKRLQKRLRQLLGDQGPPARLHLATGFPLLDEGGEEALERWLLAHPEARLIVVDTLKRFRPREKAGASIYNLDYDALAPLADLAHAYGVAIVVVHHCRKSDAEDPLDLISGSTGLTGAADGAIVLTRARGQAEAELHVTHRDADDAELALRWDEQLSGWRLLGDAEEHRRSDARIAVLEALREAPEPLTPKDLSEVLEKPYAQVKALLWKMAKDGEVRASNGRYTGAGGPAKPPAATANPVNPVDCVYPVYPVYPPPHQEGRPAAGGSTVNGVNGGGGSVYPTPLPLHQEGAPPREGVTVNGVNGVNGAPGGDWLLCTIAAHAGHARRTAHGEVCGVCHPAPWQEVH